MLRSCSLCVSWGPESDSHDLSLCWRFFMQFSSQKLHRRSLATSFWKERSEAQISRVFIGSEIEFLRSHWSTGDASTPTMFAPLLLTRSFKVSDTQVKLFFSKLFCFSWSQAWSSYRKIFFYLQVGHHLNLVIIFKHIGPILGQNVFRTEM